MMTNVRSESPFVRWLAALGLGRPELRAWAMYDWANSAMVTTIIAAVFPIYFVKVAGAGLRDNPEASKALATQYRASASTVGMVLIAVISPIVGTIADARPIKKRLLGGFLAIGLAAVS